MLSILIAFIACAAAAAACFLGLTAIGVDKDIAKLLATLMLGAFPKLRELIEKVLAERRGEPVPARIKDLLNYKLNPALALVYVTIAGYAAVQVGSFFGGAIGGFLGATPSGTTAAIGVVVVIFSLPILYLCGRWVGRRSRSMPYLVAFSAGVLVRAAAYWIDPLFVPEETVREMLSGERDFLMHFVYGAALYSFAMLVGAYMGTRQQLTTYFGYLLGRLPPDTRAALVELAHDEAVRLSAPSPSKN